MKKKLILIFAIVAIALAGIFGYLRSATRKHSPADKVVYEQNDVKIEISYCRPYRKNRLIFGEEKNGALQPYGKYWRAGANEATTFQVNKDIVFNEQPLKAGIYSLYTIPGESRWIIALNKDFDRWGFLSPDEDNDVLRTEVAANNQATEQEQFLIAFSQADSIGNTFLNLHWEHTMVSIPISIK